MKNAKAFLRFFGAVILLSLGTFLMSLAITVGLRAQELVRVEPDGLSFTTLLALLIIAIVAVLAFLKLKRPADFKELQDQGKKLVDKAVKKS